MKLKRPILPQDIDADLAIAVTERNVESAFRATNVPLKIAYAFKGVHERTAKGDLVQISATTSARRHLLKYAVKRDSLYHILPEYLFHPLDRYADTEGNKEAFMQKRAAQQQVEKDALEYFHPFDVIFQRLRTRFQHKLNDEVVSHNTFVADFIIGGHDENIRNEFISRCLPCLEWLRAHRGNPKMEEVALKFALNDNMVSFHRTFEERWQTIDSSSVHMSLDGTLDNLFAGDRFCASVYTIEVKYQTIIPSESRIQQLKGDVAEFEEFFQKWFLPIGSRLHIDFGDFKKAPVLCVGTPDNDLYMNYNTQLL